MKTESAPLSCLASQSPLCSVVHQNPNACSKLGIGRVGMNPTPLGLALGVVLVTFVLVYVAQNRRSSYQRYLPPGPRPLLIVGNAHQMPLEYPEKLSAQWKHVYGDLIFLQMFNTPMLIVNSAKAVRDLLKERSAKYSNRPYSVMLTDLCAHPILLAIHACLTNILWQFECRIGCDADMGLMPYGDRFRKHRRWIQTPFSDKAFLAHFVPVHTREIHALLSNLLRDPDNFPKHLHRLSASLAR